MILNRCFVFVRYLIFPYWWMVGVLKTWRCLAGVKEPSLLRDYVKHREGLKSAQFDKECISSSTPTTLSSPKESVEWLYGLLSVLDSKASALMRLNGVMLAAAAFLLNAGHGESGAGSFVRVAPEKILWIAALTSVSIALCLLVVSVDWRFLGCVRETDAKLDYTIEIINLERVSIFRQYVYRTAWLVSFAATVLFVIAFVSLIRN